MNHRRIILMRHAKSDWRTDAPTDHLRPLNRRGQREAPLTAARLESEGWLPDLVYSSDAVRTRETWLRMKDAWSMSPPVHLVPDLYLGGPDEIARTLTEAPRDAGRIMLLGHNPGWEDALEWLTGEASPLKTAWAALLEARDGALEWASLVGAAGGFRLVNTVRPR